MPCKRKWRRYWDLICIDVCLEDQKKSYNFHSSGACNFRANDPRVGLCDSYMNLRQNHIPLAYAAVFQKVSTLKRE